MSVWNPESALPHHGFCWVVNASKRAPRKTHISQQTLATFELHVDMRQNGHIIFDATETLDSLPPFGKRYDAEVAMVITPIVSLRKALAVDLIVDFDTATVASTIEKTYKKNDVVKEYQVASLRFGRSPQVVDFTIWDASQFVSNGARISVWGAKTSIFRDQTVYTACALTLIYVAPQDPTTRPVTLSSPAPPRKVARVEELEQLAEGEELSAYTASPALTASPASALPSSKILEKFSESEDPTASTTSTPMSPKSTL